MNKNQKTGLTIAIILIILIVIYAFVTTNNNGTNSADLDPTENNKNSDNLLENDEFSDNLIVVENQAPGEFAYLKQVNLSQDGWVSIYRMVDGEPNHILGAQYLPAGDHSDVVVILQAPTEADGSYSAVLHTDDGKIVETQFGRHQFDPALDKQVLTETGDWVMEEFTSAVSGSRGI